MVNNLLAAGAAVCRNFCLSMVIFWLFVAVFHLEIRIDLGQLFICSAFVELTSFIFKRLK